ncbi:hypothetical protein T11_2827, partial [Trichinella zimbabwensis]
LMTCESLFLYIFTQHADVVDADISTKADKELIDLSEDFLFKINTVLAISLKRISNSFHRSIKCGFLLLLRRCLKLIKSKFRNKLQLSGILHLKLILVSVDVKEVISQNRKQTHCLSTPHYAFD